MVLHSVANRLAGGQAPTVALERTLQAAHLDLLQPGGVPTTKVLTHSPGFTVIDNLFIWNAVRSSLCRFDASLLSSEGRPCTSCQTRQRSCRRSYRSTRVRFPLSFQRERVSLHAGPGERPVDYIEADPYTIQTIPSAEAVEILGNRATRLRGVTFMWKDLQRAFALLTLESRVRRKHSPRKLSHALGASSPALICVQGASLHRSRFLAAGRSTPMPSRPMGPTTSLFPIASSTLYSGKPNGGTRPATTALSSNPPFQPSRPLTLKTGKSVPSTASRMSTTA